MIHSAQLWGCLVVHRKVMHMAHFLGDRLKKLRETAGLQQVQVGKLLGVDRSSVNHYESGARQPSLDVLVRYAEIFHVTTDYLLGRTIRDVLDVSGLTDSEINIVKGLVTSMSVKNAEINK